MFVVANITSPFLCSCPPSLRLALYTHSAVIVMSSFGWYFGAPTPSSEPITCQNGSTRGLKPSYPLTNDMVEVRNSCEPPRLTGVASVYQDTQGNLKDKQFKLVYSCHDNPSYYTHPAVMGYCPPPAHKDDGLHIWKQMTEEEIAERDSHLRKKAEDEKQVMDMLKKHNVHIYGNEKMSLLFKIRDVLAERNNPDDVILRRFQENDFIIVPRSSAVAISMDYNNKVVCRSLK